MSGGNERGRGGNPSFPFPLINSLPSLHPRTHLSSREAQKEREKDAESHAHAHQVREKMASSLARVPMDHHANWQERRTTPSLTCPAFACPGGQAEQSPPPSPSSSSSCSDASSSSCAGTRQQSRVLHRWAAHQACDMVTTVERQAHQAELSALSANSEPVSSRAATFLLRETSPVTPPPQPSRPSSPGARGGVDDLPPNVRASSLIQMWRELEADAGQAPAPPCAAGGSCCGGNSSTVGGCVPSALKSCGTSEACDDSKCEPELTGRSQVSCTDGGHHSEPFLHEPSPSSSSSSSSSLVFGENANSVLLNEATVRPLARWREIDSLLVRMKQERRQELDRLLESHPVSRFSHRSRIQSLLGFRGTHRLMTIQHQQHHGSTALDLDSLWQGGSAIWFLREIFPTCQQRDNVGQVADDKDIPILLRDSSSGLTYGIIADQPVNSSPQDQEVASASASQTVLREDNLSQSTSEDLQEDRQTSTFSWLENNLQINNIEWQRSIESSNLDLWEGVLIAEEPEIDSQNNVEDANGTWASTKDCRSNRQAIDHELSDNFPDNVEIKELLQRRPVSMSLASNFRVKMDRLVLSLLERQQSMVCSRAEEEVQPVLGQNDGFGYTDKAASSLSIVPSPFQTSCSPDSQQGSCITYQSSHQFHETELMRDLRNDMAEIHLEIAELHKMIESCIDGQSKLQNLIRQEVSSMIYNSAGITLSLLSSKWAPTKKGNCCVCCEMRIDSLLYRCGHMCTCYKCAQELQSGTGRCPICRAPIVDVVRAYSET